MTITHPFAALRSEILRQPPLRAAITAAYRQPETEAVPPLLDLAALKPDEAERARVVARSLVEKLRARTHSSGVEGLIHEYSLSSQEGVALMCLAEALLRIPDMATRDALIRDKLAGGDWRAHVGASPSLFVNAATWGLVLTGRLVATSSEQSLGAALTRLIARSGEPIIRAGVDVAMRLMGEQFVTGRTIEEAINASRDREARGFTFSYDMLGEAAITAEDAARYLSEYERAVHAIGRASHNRGIYEGPGMSIKPSALHPRFSRIKRGRVMAELLPRIKHLAAQAKSHDISFNIDAEEMDRLDLSLDLLAALCNDPDLADWNGLGFVVQTYGKRASLTVDWLIDLARSTRRRLMIRLVKGAYWDAEIKRAQLDGLDGFPVFTRKVHSDVCYLACARKLLAAPDAIYPQFATHNAQTLAAVMTMAGSNFYRGQYEFQCLHGMGEPLYEEVVGRDKLNRPCRVYAPVGSHETLLAYLVRRLLENGSNTSFVNRIADMSVPIDELIADPVAVARTIEPIGAPHEKIALPRHLYGSARLNSRGLDFSNEQRLAELADNVEACAKKPRRALPAGAPPNDPGELVRNPADSADIVGFARHARPDEIAAAIAAAVAAAPAWAAVPPNERAAILRRAADRFEAMNDDFVGLIVREAGKSYANAVGEVREACDFLRYYGAEAARTLSPGSPAPLGVVACISPWNFPLAIFTGQVAAALAAGNAVVAKPAEETPLIAAEAVSVLHEAGVPPGALRFIPGAGEVGAAIVDDPRIEGVVFTGSTVVGRLIEKQLAGRLTRRGAPVPLIAETGGLNAMVVDSSALPEQVVGDALASAFDSAGQRCSALRILCLQDDVADRMMAMLKGAMAELEVGDPRRLSTDVGPVITPEARDAIRTHIETMWGRGFTVTQAELSGDAAARGTFVAPALIEVNRISDVEREVFGPVMHVLRFKREELDSLIDAINAAGYGLTFGLHTRIDETIARVVDRIEAGNVYINRNIIGATVGVQPFGGSRLSGTGPKAGGPLYLSRLLAEPTPGALEGLEGAGAALSALRAYIDWLRQAGHGAEAERCVALMARSPLGARVELQGPVGERNVYGLRRRGRVAAVAATTSGFLIEIGAILAAGDDAVGATSFSNALKGLPAEFARRVTLVPDPLEAPGLAGALFEGGADALSAAARKLALRPGPIVRLQALTPERLAAGEDFSLADLVEELSVATNTSAAGGNASLMTIG